MEQSCVSGNCRRYRSRQHPCQAEPGLWLCRSCCSRLRADIAELPQLYQECEFALAQVSLGLDRQVRRRKRQGFFLNEAALDARSDIKSVLATWSGMVANERRVTNLIRREVSDLATFLTIHLDWLLAHPAGPRFVDEIGAIAMTARQACRPRPALHLELGQCVQEDCHGALSVTSSIGDTTSPVQVRCEAGHAWQPHEWLLLARRANRGMSAAANEVSRVPDEPAGSRRSDA